METGGPAFPMHYEVTEKSEMVVSYDGMTLRDYFAGQALIGIMSNDELLKALVSRNPDKPFDMVAEKCGKQADAMLKERNK